MTPEALATEYLRREREANATPQGANHRAILTALSDENGLSYADVRVMVLDHTVMRAC